MTTLVWFGCRKEEHGGHGPPAVSAPGGSGGAIVTTCLNIITVTWYISRSIGPLYEPVETTIYALRYFF